jgi:hypothetical protein
VLSDWWNGVELWMLGLPFPLQFALVVVVLAPVCLVVAWLIDRIVDHTSALFAPTNGAEQPIGSHHTEAAEDTAETDTDVEAAEADAAEERVPAESAGR